MAQNEAPMELVRLAAAGSVDDGKSSLIGRLLFDSKSLYQDQIEAVEEASRRRGADQVELALLTDGLRAEREQNITIDVAYRFFSSGHRRFIIADTPGHEQYTRSMVTGASTADLAVVLADAGRGLTEQSRRHAAVCAVLGVPQVVFAVNKMDLADFAERRFRELEQELLEAAASLGIKAPTAIPISALMGDNVVTRSQRMPWYHGPTLVECLQTAPIERPLPGADLLLPVQCVIIERSGTSSEGDGGAGPRRWFAGQAWRGSLRQGQAITVFPEGAAATIAAVRKPDGPADESASGAAVSVALDREVNVRRGSVLYEGDPTAHVTRRVTAVLCWLGREPLRMHHRYRLLHGPRQVSVQVDAIENRLDMTSLKPMPADGLGPNDIGEAVLTLAEPIFADLYRDSKAGGSFILVDESTKVTAAAGMIRSIEPESGPAADTRPKLMWLTGSDWRSRWEAVKVKASGQILLIDEDELAATLNSDAPNADEIHRRLLSLARLLLAQGADAAVISSRPLSTEETASFGSSLIQAD